MSARSEDGEPSLTFKVKKRNAAGEWVETRSVEIHGGADYVPRYEGWPSCECPLHADAEEAPRTAG